MKNARDRNAVYQVGEQQVEAKKAQARKK